MLELRRTEPVDVDVRIFFADVLQKIDVPLERQFRVMSALHQDLNATRCRKFVQFPVNPSPFNETIPLNLRDPRRAYERFGKSWFFSRNAASAWLNSLGFSIITKCDTFSHT